MQKPENTFEKLRKPGNSFYKLRKTGKIPKGNENLRKPENQEKELRKAGKINIFPRKTGKGPPLTGPPSSTSKFGKMNHVYVKDNMMPLSVLSSSHYFAGQPGQHTAVAKQLQSQLTVGSTSIQTHNTLTVVPLHL